MLEYLSWENSRQVLLQPRTQGVSLRKWERRKGWFYGRNSRKISYENQQNVKSYESYKTSLKFSETGCSIRELSRPSILNTTCSHNAAKSLGVLSSCPVLRAKSGRVRSPLQLTVESRFDRAEKALWLGCAREISSRFIMFSALNDSAQANHPAIEVW